LEIDWKQLTAVAKTAMEKAYAPYSNFPVGVAALVDDGRVISGCNVENEHAAEGMLLQTISGIKPITEVLPDAFGPKDLGK